jgi:hypothetical protein
MLWIKKKVSYVVFETRVFFDCVSGLLGLASGTEVGGDPEQVVMKNWVQKVKGLVTMIFVKSLLQIWT